MRPAPHRECRDRRQPGAPPNPNRPPASPPKHSASGWQPIPRYPGRPTGAVTGRTPHRPAAVAPARTSRHRIPRSGMPPSTRPAGAVTPQRPPGPAPPSSFARPARTSGGQNLRCLLRLLCLLPSSRVVGAFPPPSGAPLDARARARRGSHQIGSGASDLMGPDAHSQKPAPPPCLLNTDIDH